MAFDLYHHQLDALEEIHNGSVIRGNVGSGKSRTALAYAFKTFGGRLDEVDPTVRTLADGSTAPCTWRSFHFDYEGIQRPRDIYVITTAKKRDSREWEAEALAFAISTHRDKSIRGIQLKVDSWNNIDAYTDVKDAFFIFDEQRLVGSGAWVKAFWKIAKQNEWILLSATPGDTWIDYAPIFVANGFYKNRSEFMREHVVYARYSRYPKIDRYIGTGRLAAYRDRILVEMPDSRHTVRHEQIVETEFDKALFERLVKDRWNIYEERPIRDVAELFRLMRQLVNSDPSRLKALQDLTASNPRLIVFYNFNYELEALRILTQDLGVAVAEWNGQKHEEIPDEKSWIYLVQYTAGAEGWNCVSTNAMVFFSLNYSYRLMEQGKGRIDRMNTPYVDLYYYIFKSNSLIDKAIWKALHTKKNFNEKKFEKEMKWEVQSSAPHVYTLDTETTTTPSTANLVNA